MIRAAVVGARRVRQGIGFHLARFLASGGAEVCAVVGRTPATAAHACAALRAEGLEPRPYADTRGMLRAEAPDVLVIASPHETHADLLDLALDAGCHVLCEKPLVWGDPGDRQAARSFVEAFLARDRHLVVNAQWPLTLEVYRALHPTVFRQPPRTFDMRLSPGSTGAPMVPDGLPHALSLLAAVLPDPEATVEAIRVRPLGRDARGADVRFSYLADGHEVDARVQLRRVAGQPRPAGYAFDGLVARRRVETEGYRLFLGDGARELSLPDPTPALVHAFLSRVSCGERPRPDPSAWPGMKHLIAIHDAWPR